jgi:uncharacterized protein YqeY
MPSLHDTLQNDMRDAMRARADLKLQTLRMVLAAVKNARIEKGSDLEDADVRAILVKAIKTRRESVEQFRKGNREEMAAKEESEIALLQAYLPQALTEAETAEAVKALIAELTAGGPPLTKRDMGRVMKEAQTRFAGRADNKLVSMLVGEQLQ